MFLIVFYPFLNVMAEDESIEPAEVTEVQDYEVEADSKEKNWEFLVAPYFFMAQLSGDVTVKGRTAEVDMSFVDIVKMMNFAFMLHNEVWWKKQLGLIVDFMYLNVGNGIPIQDQPLVDDIDLNAKLVFVDSALGFKIGEVLLANRENYSSRDHVPAMTFQLMVGGRYAYLNEKLSFDPGPTVSDTREWGEIFLGMRIKTRVSKNWHIIVKGDVGGFKMGSDLTWNALVLADYRFAKVASFIFGYRGFGVNYSSGVGIDETGLDVVMNGPQIGFGFHF
jgi:hypothetical protein